MILPPSDPQFTGRGFDPAAALRATHPAVPAPTELCAAQHAFLERTRALVSSDEAAQARAEIAATRAALGTSRCCQAAITVMTMNGSASE